ncbi:MAG: hypothetical protein PHX61_12780 [Alphaproteobacteria bacterium]|nr:hypothetical protein [Alphaproteobacteria bacterium]
MKEYKVYVCEKCGEEFTEGFPEGYEKCFEHEKTHVGIAKYGIHKPEYLGPASTYPNYIEVEMTDGSIQAYEATGVIVKEATEKESPQEAD